MKVEKEARFVCDYPGCDKVFNRRDYLERHAANHLDVKPFACYPCSRQFSRKDLYDNHLQTKFHAKRLQELGEVDESTGDSVNSFNEHHSPSSSTSSQSIGMSLGDSAHPLWIASAVPSAPSPSDSYFHTHGAHGGASQLGQGPRELSPSEISLRGRSTVAGGHQFGLRATSQDVSDDSSLPSIPNVMGRSTPAGATGSAGPSSVSADYRRSNSNYDYSRNPSSFLYSSPSSAQDADVWEFYRPLKRINTLSALAEDLEPRSKYGRTDFGMPASPSLYSTSTASSLDSRGNSLVSANSGGSRDHASSISSFSSASSGGSARSRSTDVQRSWIAGRLKNESPELRKGIEVLREPPRDASPRSVEYNERYRWFFDDKFSSENEKYGYDKIYREAVKMYSHRAKKYDTRYGRQELLGPRSVNPKTADLVLSVLKDAPNGFFRDRSMLTAFMEVAWQKAPGVSYVVHRPSHDPSNSHPALLAVLVMLGMALSDDVDAKEAARAVYPAVSLYTYESLDQPDGPMVTRYSAPYIGHLQAFCILLRYESAVLGAEIENLSLVRFSGGKQIVDKFLYAALTSVPHVPFDSSDSKQSVQSKRNPIWATVSREVYVFHQGADRELQWKEWAAYEMCKRTVHFAFYSDSIIKISQASGDATTNASLFLLNTHMICPDALWEATSWEELFYIIGPNLVVSNVPFLGLVKSLVRFPRVVSPISVNGSVNELQKYPLSKFAIRMIAYALINIVGRLTGVFATGETISSVVLRQSISNVNSELDVAPFFEQDVQARMYRGLDIWFKYFEETYGDVSDRLFKVADALGIDLQDGMVQGGGEGSEQGGVIPEYSLVIVLYHLASFIMLHEDLPIVLQVTSNLSKWVTDEHGNLISQDALLRFLYMPLYVQWILTDEAKAIVSTCSLFLAWVTSSSMMADSRKWNTMFLSSVTYISVLVIWLYDLTVTYNQAGGDMSQYKAGPIDLDSFDFVDEALEYLQNVHSKSEKSASARKKASYAAEHPKASIRSVLLLGACLLQLRRPYTAPLVDMLVKLLCVIEPSMKPDKLYDVLSRVEDFFDNRMRESRGQHDEPSVSESALVKTLS